MKVSIIAAVADNGVIGLDGELPWDIPEELAEFKRRTFGHPIILGRKTFQSVGVLPGRQTIVMTRKDLRVRDPRCHVVHTWAQAREVAGWVGSSDGVSEMFVCGGAQVYQDAMPEADNLYISWLDLQSDGDTYFPAINPRHWVTIDKDHRYWGCIQQYHRIRF